MIKINFLEKRIYITSNHSELIETLGVNNAFVVFELTKPKIASILNMLKDTSIENILIVGDEQLNFDLLKQTLKSIIAAGGIVFNESDEILFIYRRKKWDLPKGKLDDGEQIDECALREVMEETGVKDLIIEKLLCETYHLYEEKGKMIFKTTYWYIMRSKDILLKPQAEEGIDLAVWATKSQVVEYMKNTYETIRELIQKV